MAWNPADKYTGVTLSNGNKTAEVTGGTIGGVRATQARNEGKYYFELLIDAIDSNGGMVGISSLSHPIASYNSYLGGTWNVLSMAYPSINAGSCYYKMPNYGSDVCPRCYAGDVIGVAVDFDGNNVRFYRNGVETIWNAALDNIPTGTNEVYPSWSPSSYTSASRVTLRETGSEMSYLPAGFLAWDGTGGGPPDRPWLLHSFNGLVKGMKGAAKSAFPFFDGNKFVMKEAAGGANKILTLDANGDLAWIDAPTAPDASETVKGIAEIATQAEVDGGTDTTRTVTPATLQGRIGASSGIAPLDPSGKVPTANLPESGEAGGASVSVPASESLAAGDMVNLWNDAGTLKARKAGAATTSELAKACYGFVDAAVTAGNTATVKTSGIVTPTILGGSLTPGAWCYMEDSSFGGYVTHSCQLMDGYTVQRVGLALTTTSMLFGLERANSNRRK